MEMRQYALTEDRRAPFRSGDLVVKIASDPWERSGYFSRRREIFCTEQGLYADDDRDDTDRWAIPIVAVACLGGMLEEVVGVVRIFQEGDGTWWGGRLGVTRPYRRHRTLGKALITKAVCTANARGCSRFFAHVQNQNVKFFRTQHWRELESQLQLRSYPHSLMEAELDHYPPEAGYGERFQPGMRLI